MRKPLLPVISISLLVGKCTGHSIYPSRTVLDKTEKWIQASAPTVLRTVAVNMFTLAVHKQRSMPHTLCARAGHAGVKGEAQAARSSREAGSSRRVRAASMYTVSSHINFHSRANRPAVQ